MGLPLVAVPFMAGFLGAEHAIVVMQIPGLVSNVWLVWRHRGTVRHRALAAADHAFFRKLARGESLQDAASAATAVDATHDAAALFGEALASSILKGSRP